MKTAPLRRRRLIAGVIAWLVSTIACAAATVVDENLSPAQITIGESAELTIKSSGTDLQSPALPAVAGLEFRVIERLHGIEVVHGASVATTTTVVRVTPQVAGTFVIPAIASRSQPLILQVNPANLTGAPAAARAGVAAETAANGIRMTGDGAAFIRLTATQREVYVGESVPITIEVGMRGGAVSSLNGLPALAGSDFTLNNLSRRPERTERIIDGKPFVLLTWHSVLAPVKPGAFSILVEAPLTVRVSTRPRNEVLLEDQLGDPFMQRVFGATVPKDIKAASPALRLNVVALPAEGRPAQFSGAVGTFKISSDISPAAAAAGDPLTLRMHVVGAGNFDRVDSAMLEHAADWKTYPPSSSFKASDGIGFKGEKVFEQPVIASKSGVQTLPALTFSYFDPVRRRYETARSSPLAVTISASPAELAADGIAAGGGAPLRGGSAMGLRPDRRAPGTRADSLTPLYLRQRFLAIPSLLTLTFAGAWLQLRRRADADRDPARPDRGASKALRRALAQLEQAARAGDSVQFFALARHALRQTLAARWQMAPGQITTAEVNSRLGTDNAGNEIRELFALADEADYAGRQLDRADLTRWTHVVGQTLGKPAP